MKTEQKTVDDLKKEIDVLSISKNQHQAAVEEEQKKLKDIKKEIKFAEAARRSAFSETDIAYKEEKNAKEKLQIVINEVHGVEKSMSSLNGLCMSLQADIEELEKDKVRVQEEFAKVKSALDSKIAMHKEGISNLCNKIKAEL